MLQSEKYKTQSGKEIEIHPLTKMQEAEVRDICLLYINKGGETLSFTACIKACQFAIRENTEVWEFDDVYEVGAKVISKITEQQITKKKSQ